MEEWVVWGYARAFDDEWGLCEPLWSVFAFFVGDVVLLQELSGLGVEWLLFGDGDAITFFECQEECAPSAASQSPDEHVHGWGSCGHGFVGLTEFEEGECGGGEDCGDEPESDDDDVFVPSFELEVVVDRCHSEDALSGSGSPACVFEVSDLEDDGKCFQEEDAAQ